MMQKQTILKFSIALVLIIGFSLGQQEAVIANESEENKEIEVDEKKKDEVVADSSNGAFIFGLGLSAIMPIQFIQDNGDWVPSEFFFGYTMDGNLGYIHKFDQSHSLLVQYSLFFSDNPLNTLLDSAEIKSLREGAGQSSGTEDLVDDFSGANFAYQTMDHNLLASHIWNAFPGIEFSSTINVGVKAIRDEAQSDPLFRGQYDNWYLGALLTLNLPDWSKVNNNKIKPLSRFGGSFTVAYHFLDRPHFIDVIAAVNQDILQSSVSNAVDVNFSDIEREKGNSHRFDVGLDVTALLTSETFLAMGYNFGVDAWTQKKTVDKDSFVQTDEDERVYSHKFSLNLNHIFYNKTKTRPIVRLGLLGSISMRRGNWVEWDVTTVNTVVDLVGKENIVSGTSGGDAVVVFPHFKDENIYAFGPRLEYFLSPKITLYLDNITSFTKYLGKYARYIDGEKTGREEGAYKSKLLTNFANLTKVGFKILGGSDIWHYHPYLGVQYFDSNTDSEDYINVFVGMSTEVKY